MSEMVEVLIGGAESDHVRIRVVGREIPSATDYWDGNWLVTPIELRVGRFSGTLPADLRAEELRRFRSELEAAYERLDGEAVLASLDGWITLTVQCERNGSLRIAGVANDHPGVGNELEFHLEDLDQSHLPPIIEALKVVEEHYPVRSTPDG